MTVDTVGLIKKEIHHALRADHRVDARGITVDISQNAIVLKGEVPSFTSIRVAEAIAKKVSGGRVKNYLRSKVTPLFASP